MNMSQAAIDTLVKPFEGLRLKAYKPTPTDPWTCGYGSTVGVDASTVWTMEQADTALLRDVADADRIGNLFFATATQNEFDAITDCIFNIGPGMPGQKDGIVRLANGRYSSLYTYWRNGYRALAGDEIPKWCHVGAHELPGLKARRAADLLWFNGQHPAQHAADA